MRGEACELKVENRNLNLQCQTLANLNDKSFLKFDLRSINIFRPSF